MKQRGKVIGIVLLIAAVAIGSLVGYWQYEAVQQKEAQRRAEQAQLISSHYSAWIHTVRETTVYEQTEEGYVAVGRIGADIIVEPQPMEITHESEYFYIPSLQGYVYYEDVMPQEEKVEYDTRHLQYIPFNQTAVVDRTILYDEQGTLLYDLPIAGRFPIYINEEDKVGVDYDNRLVWIKRDDIREIAEETNSTAKKAKAIRVLCYHKVYDPKSEDCPTIICHTKSQVSKHFSYLKEKGYFTMSMQEMLWYLTKKINVPYNSVCITFDDGGKNTKYVIELLEKYDLHATLFLIGKNYGDFMISDHLELQSHTYAMHTYGHCNVSPRGSAILCKDKETVMADLKKSKELTNAIAFAYPYYEYNKKTIAMVKEAGFLLAFEDEKGLVKPGDDPYTISRYTLTSYAMVNELASILH